VNSAPLCHIHDIPDGQSKGFAHQGVQILAVRQQEQLFLYHNRCPHLGIPLEWQADQFLNYDRSLIQCNTHGALFTIDTGECINGPCTGQYLSSVTFTIKDDYVYLTPTTPTNETL
jgi:nitrite reductase/ring-hydroxylating ferredoxin subunit